MQPIINPGRTEISAAPTRLACRQESIRLKLAVAVAVQVVAHSSALMSNLQRDGRALPLQPVDFVGGCQLRRERHAIKKRPGRRFNLEWVAERVGFEPTVNLRSRLISSQVHSTTLPPLRDAHCNRVGRFAGRKNHSRSDCAHAPDKNNRIVRETGCACAYGGAGGVQSSCGPA